MGEGDCVCGSLPERVCGRMQQCTEHRLPDGQTDREMPQIERAREHRLLSSVEDLMGRAKKPTLPQTRDSSWRKCPHMVRFSRCRRRMSCATRSTASLRRFFTSMWHGMSGNLSCARPRDVIFNWSVQVPAHSRYLILECFKDSLLTNRTGRRDCMVPNAAKVGKLWVDAYSTGT